MNKIKNFGLIVLAIFLITSVISGNLILKRYKQEKAERIRLQQNQEQLLTENQTYSSLLLTKDEALSIASLKLDSVLNLLKIRPKTITKIIEKLIIDRDTVDKPVSVSPVENNLWFIADSDKCFLWQGTAFLSGKDLNVERTYFDYHNKIIDLFWWERPKKFLFIHFGKKKNFQKSLPECGETMTREITIIKK